MLVLALAFVTLNASNLPGAPQQAANDIMKRVAQNQDREQQARNQFVYQQNIHRTMRRKDGKLVREEFWSYTVIPGAKGTEKKLLSVHGRYWKKGRYLTFDGEPVPAGLLSITLDDEEGTSRDGIDKDLFPLTTEEQKKYTFEFLGERIVDSRPAYRIQFHPTDKADYGWTGEALIDREELQPVTLYTRLSRKLPLAVRTVLGTDVPGLGFSIRYTRIDKDLWFPSSYGTEFKIRALFLLDRTITESMENTDFRRASVDSRLSFNEDNESKEK